jgi:hypothetical protein
MSIDLFGLLPVIIALLPTSQSVHYAIASVEEPLPTENNNILGLKCSLRHSKQIPNLVIAPLPTAV